jgi:uncharacterized protein (DUF983 family)
MVPSQANLKSGLFWTFFRRALRLRCPECGLSRIFKPLRQTRSLDDWFRPLHGCRYCDYEYQREPGYFLISICVVNYGVITGGAILAALLIDALFSPPWWIFIFVFAPMPLLSLLFVRHAKSLFLAIDHFIEPQKKVT